MTAKDTDFIVLGARREIARIEEILSALPEGAPARSDREEELEVLRLLERGAVDMAALLAEHEEEPVNPRVRLMRAIADLNAQQIHHGGTDRAEALERLPEPLRPLVVERIDELEFIERLRLGEEGDR